MTQKTNLKLANCTACRIKIEVSNKENLYRHKLVNTLICSKCCELYGDGDFSKYENGIDEDGDDNFCRWCADGGDLFICCKDGCHYAFCERCIKYNVGDELFKIISESEDWQCFACNPEQISELIKATDKLFSAASNTSSKSVSKSKSAKKERSIKGIAETKEDTKLIERLTVRTKVEDSMKTPQGKKPEHRAKKSTGKPAISLINNNSFNKDKSSSFLIADNVKPSNKEDKENNLEENKEKEIVKEDSEDSKKSISKEDDDDLEMNDLIIKKTPEIIESPNIDVFDEETFSEDEFRDKLNEKTKIDRHSISIGGDIDLDENEDVAMPPSPNNIEQKSGTNRPNSPEIFHNGVKNSYFELNKWIDESKQVKDDIDSINNESNYDNEIIPGSSDLEKEKNEDSKILNIFKDKNDSNEDEEVVNNETDEDDRETKSNKSELEKMLEDENPKNNKRCNDELASTINGDEISTDDNLHSSKKRKKGEKYDSELEDQPINVESIETEDDEYNKITKYIEKYLARLKKSKSCKTSTKQMKLINGLNDLIGRVNTSHFNFITYQTLKSTKD